MTLLATVAAIPLVLLPGGPESACLTGRVLDLAARPVSGAMITMIAQQPGYASPIRAGVDRSGTFSVGALNPGSYWLIVERLGFQPEIQLLQLGPAQAWMGEMRLTPLEAFLEVAEGRSELPWLLRGIGSDPLRFSPAWSEGESRWVQGRVGIQALAADADAGGSLIGQRTRLALEGVVSDDIGWWVDGRLDAAYGGTRESVIGGNHVTYGVDFAPSPGTLAFRGEFHQISHGQNPESDFDTSLVEERRSSYRLDYKLAQPDDNALDLSLAFLEARRDDGLSGGQWNRRHAVWDGQGTLTHRIDEEQRLRLRLAVVARDWRAPEPQADLAFAPLASWGTGASVDTGAKWQFALVPSWEWEVVPGLLIEPSVELMRFVGAASRSMARPGLTFRYQPDALTEVAVAASWLAMTSGLVDATDSEPLGLTVSIRREIGFASMRVEARANEFGTFDLQTPARSGLTGEGRLQVMGHARSREVRFEVMSSGTHGVRGRAGAEFGYTEGGFGIIPLGPGLASASEREIVTGPMQFAGATFGGELVPTNTDIVIRYRWLQTAATGAAGRIEHVELELGQALPWSVAGARLDLQLALRGFLRRSTASEDTDSNMLALTTPIFAAGLGVRF